MFLTIVVLCKIKKKCIVLLITQNAEPKQFLPSLGTADFRSILMSCKTICPWHVFVAESAAFLLVYIWTPLDYLFWTASRCSPFLCGAVCLACTVFAGLLHCANEGVLGYPACQNFPHQLYLRDFMYCRNSTLSWHLAQCLSGLVHLCGPWLDGRRTDKSVCPWLLGVTEEVWKGLRPDCGVTAVGEKVCSYFFFHLNGER